MQRSTAVNARDLCGFLKLLLIGLILIYIIISVFVFVFVAAAGRPISLPRLGLAAVSSPAGTLLAGFSSASLGPLLAASLVFSLLLLDKLLDLLAPLEIMTLGAVDLAVLLVGVVLFVSDRHSLAVGACGNLLAGATSFAGAASSLSDPPAPVFSTGSFLPSSARAHLSARAYSSLTSLILHISISSRSILRFRTF